VTSCDTNILFPAFDRQSVLHDRARHFLASQSGRADFCLCEQVLMELYCLLRNPTVCREPLSADVAAGLIQGLRSNPVWRIVDVVPGQGIMDRVWQQAAAPGFACRRLFDARLAAVLKHHGVSEFATRNSRDFQGLGFTRVWDPLV
jgi:toxin-antitoxin system PIN domain toxin